MAHPIRIGNRRTIESWSAVGASTGSRLRDTPRLHSARRAHQAQGQGLPPRPQRRAASQRAGKGGKTRYLPLHPGTNGLINDYLDAAGHGADDAGALFRPVRNNTTERLDKAR
jgi:hypothetical protein